MRLFALVMLLAVVSAPAMAAGRKVELINNSGATMTKFYASNTGANDWQENILGRDTLANGETVSIDLDDGTGYCKFDFKAVFQDGSSTVKEDVNACAISSFTYTP